MSESIKDPAWDYVHEHFEEIEGHCRALAFELLNKKRLSYYLFDKAIDYNIQNNTFKYSVASRGKGSASIGNLTFSHDRDKAIDLIAFQIAFCEAMAFERY
jgi:type VI protein secretion system component Hcp